MINQSEGIYLDYAAHTPAHPDVLKAFCDAECRYTANPTAKHEQGYQARSAMDSATQQIATLLAVPPEQIIYTSGASEANNLAIKGTARAARHIGNHIICSPLEHPSVSGALTALQEQGAQIDVLRLNKSGTVDIEQLAELIREDTIMVSVCAVDSELGVVQPIEQIKALLKDYENCRLMVDATQAIGKIPLDLSGIHLVTLSAHKFYGICGSGMLIKGSSAPLEPLLHGGESTTIYRSGTPTVSLIHSTAVALSKAMKNQPTEYEQVKRLNQTLRQAFSSYRDVTINSPEHAIPHILNLSVKGIKGRDFQKLLSDRGVFVSVKSACSTENTPSRAVLAISGDRKNALCSWRISLSGATTFDEITSFLKIFDEIYKENANET